MVEDGEKTRFAMGLFDDLPRLKTAVRDLTGLGLHPSNMCVAGERAAVENSNAEAWAGLEHVARFIPSQSGKIVLSVIPEATFWDANIPILRAFEEVPRPHAGSSLLTDTWASIGDRLSKGTLLLVTLVPSVALQNEAMRILLRYSRYPVHADEFLRIN